MDNETKKRRKKGVARKSKTEETGDGSSHMEDEDEIQIVEETVIIQSEDDRKENKDEKDKEKDEERKAAEKEKTRGFSFGSKLKKMNPLRKLGKSKKEDSVEIKEEKIETVWKNNEERLKTEDPEKEDDSEEDSPRKEVTSAKKKPSKGRIFLFGRLHLVFLSIPFK